MRKSHIFLFIIALVMLVASLWHSEIYAACGGSWYSTSCPVSPYVITGDAQQLGYDATKASVNGQITDKGLSVFVQQIITYL
ncbi:hypothetical protein H7169_03560, partial [Candidatus Gracilibacteria bacterium]|nr:hypothetical protein [Candidatus Gracilibacteria bacterium]